MTIFFQIHYQTAWGQQLVIFGPSRELGDGAAEKGLLMRHQGEGVWQASLPFKKMPASLSYKYAILEADGSAGEEAGEWRQVRIPNAGNQKVWLKDSWRPADHVDNVFATAAFKEVIFRPEKTWKSAVPVKADKGLHLHFQIVAPRVPGNMQLALLGNVPELGAWDYDRAVLLGNAQFPTWSVELTLTPGLVLEYKYGLADSTTGKVMALETGDNRKLALTALVDQPDAIVVSDEHFRYPGPIWKGAGVAIPVFSLRSEDGLGVGEFRDLRLMVDWAKKTGLKMVQVLPVNDTTVNYTWTDSYPYSAISVFALHPMFLSLSAIKGAEKIIGRKQLNDARKKLNESPTVDYDGVINTKKAFARKVFDVTKDDFLKNPAFLDFFEQSKHWLEPYAAFCYLRDRFKTADFKEWGAYAVFSPAILTELTDPKGEAYFELAFHYFLQFHLDQQLKDASDYARANGVVMKGDLPIGIYRHSVDAWVEPRLYNMNGQAGAPPDPFSANGQNWGFPTYNWEEMEKDGYLWWRQRMYHLARYFDAYRIDHILGFFRIWEIPLQHVEGLLGRFRPAIPITPEEFRERGIAFDRERFCQPHITEGLLQQLFGEDASYVKQTFLRETSFNHYAFVKSLDTQRKMEAFLEQPGHADKMHLREGLFALTGEVLFIEEPDAEGEAFHPRFGLDQTHSYRSLPADQQHRIYELYLDYFFSRQEEFWREEAMKKLPALKKATNMLICGEDLGMVPGCVPGVMRELSILSLEIQRMSKNPATEFLQEADIPYLSVSSPSTHDMSPIRAWWEESDKDQIGRFYFNELRFMGPVPHYCEPYVAQAIIEQHLRWNNMWSVFPLQDILAIDGAIRRDNPFEERINVPSNPKHYWRYRMHLTMEELIDSEGFNGKLNKLLEQYGRI